MTTSPRQLAKTDVRGRVVSTVKVGANWLTYLGNNPLAWSLTVEDARRTHDWLVAQVEEDAR